jgi:hypothetical protein
VKVVFKNDDPRARVVLLTLPLLIAILANDFKYRLETLLAALHDTSSVANTTNPQQLGDAIRARTLVLTNHKGGEEKSVY